MSEYHHEQRSGYESGSHQETSSSNQNQQKYQSGGNSGGGGGRKWSSPYAGKPGGQSGGGRRFGGGSGGPRDQAPRDFSVDPPELYRPYTVGSNKEVSADVIQQAVEVRDMLAKNGYMTRCSVFEGLDQTFMTAKRSEIILPWKDFNGHHSKLTFTVEEAKWFAAKMHPSYERLPDAIKTFLAKDIRLLCGNNLKSLVQFFLVHSDDGCEGNATRGRETGNIGFMIGVADDLRIPTFNFAKPNLKERLMKHLRISPELA